MAEEEVLPFLPEEIIVKILQKLPVADALLRFRCVSKQWCRLISDSKIRNRKPLLLVKSVSKNKEVTFQSIDQTASCRMDENNVHLPWESTRERAHAWIYSSCDGLVLVGLMDDLFLWNPFTRHTRKFLSYSRLSESLSKKVGGFFFDSTNNEYKVVMSHNHRVVPRGSALVGSSKNKSWKHINFPYKDDTHLRCGPTLNNRIHWIASKIEVPTPSLCPTIIIYFDTTVNAFVELPLPPDRDGEGEAIVGMGVLDGCLCISRAKDFYKSEVQIFAMKIYGDADSWTSLFKVQGFLFSHSFVPIFYHDDEMKNEVVMKIHEFNICSLIVYDPSTKTRSDISTSCYSQCETLYEESLTRPTGYDEWEELESRGEAFYTEELSSSSVRTMRRDGNGCWYDVDKEERHHGEQDNREGVSTTWQRR